MTKKLKWGSVYMFIQILCTSCFILMVMCKESSKPSKLSTKLSTIWQINDYLSKKIDNRLIVDIIDTRGHPVDYLSWAGELPPWLVILWSSPGHLSVTRRLCPSKESTFVPEPAHPVNLSALNFKASCITPM